MTYKRLAALAATLLWAVMAAAQITVEAPSVVGIDEQFNVSFCLSQKADSFDWDAGENFQVVWGPQTGSSTSISIVNGKTTRTSSYTYTYILIPSRSGKFSLPAAHAVVNGSDVYSRQASIEVVGGNAQGAQSGSQGGSAQGGSAQSSSSKSSGAAEAGDAPSSDMFMKLSLNRTSVVKGEPITATLKLYVRGNISGIEDAKFPTFNGFWSQETAAPQNINFQRESVGDRIYDAAVLRKWVLIPQTVGDLKIEAAEMVLLVAQRVSTGNSMFDSFFDDYQNVKKRVHSQPCTVKVSALPQPAPASFTGAVGNFSIKAYLVKDSLTVNDATSLKLTVAGKGNVSLVAAPKIKFPLDSEVYDTKTTDNSDAGSGGTSGSRTFEYPFIPRSHGDFSIDPIEFSYYDVSKRKYVTLKTEALPYHVAQGKPGSYQGGNLSNIPSGNVQKGVKSLSEDIRYISTERPELVKGESYAVKKTGYWMLYFFVALFALSTYLFVSKMRALRSDVVFVKTRGASKLARKRLSAAKKYLDSNLYTAFYEELHKALTGYAADKLNIAASELSKENISTAFTEAGAPEETVKQYVELLEQCEFARFAPDAGNEQMVQAYDKALMVISTMDANMKKTSMFGAGSLAAILCAGGLLLSSVGTAYAQEQPAADVDSLWNAAVEAYGSGQFDQSKALFLEIERQGYRSKELYTNIGDAAYRIGDKASAILHYERALRIDPSDKDARHNLNILNSEISDRIDSVPELILSTWARKLCFLLPSDAWALTALLLFVATAALVLLFLLGRSAAAKRTGFFTGIVTLLLCIVCLVNAVRQEKMATAEDKAIVLAPVCAVKTSPSSDGQDQFILHEGTKVEIFEKVGDWVNIGIADGREGWIHSKDIEVI